jgi:glutathione S-transferase
MNTVELPLLNLLMIGWAKDGPTKYREFTIAWGNRHLTSLERWLASHEYVATDRFTVADILMAHVLAEIKDDAMIKPYGCVSSYRDRCFARSAWKRTIEKYCARVEAG